MKKLVYIALSLLLSAGLWSCSNPAWEDHYASHVDDIVGQTLMQAIDQNPDLSIFAELLRRVGLDKNLSSSQSFTVWAPVNASFEGLDTTDLTNMGVLIRNHVSRFPYTTNDLVDQDVRIRLLDNKSVTFRLDGGTAMFGSRPVLAKDKAVGNGILHTLDGYEPYVQNIWECITYTSRYSKLHKLLADNDVREFNEAASTVIGVENGMTLYDSVFYTYNPVLSQLGPLRNEDSLTTIVLPTDEAWDEAYALIKPYFHYAPFPESFTLAANMTNPEYYRELADSLCDQSVKDVIISSLSFYGLLTPQDIAAMDRITPRGSRRGNNGYIDAKAFFKNLDTYDVLSNGYAYPAEHLNYTPDMWCNTIKREAEEFSGHLSVPNAYLDDEYREVDSTLWMAQVEDARYRSIFRYDATDSWMADQISRTSYLKVSSKNMSYRPNISFDLSGSVRSIPYNIYCVFVPAELAKNSKTDPSKLKPCKVTFSLRYLADGGRPSEQVYRTVRYTDPTKMDTLLVTQDALGNPTPFTFAYAGSFAVLTVTCAMDAGEDDTYERDMCLDCILMKPVL